MVSGLIFKERDPEYPTKNRGRGWYYFRGNLTTGLVGGRGTRNPRNQRGPTWSFYSANKQSGSSKDAARAHIPRKVRSIPKKLETQPHKADYKTRKSTNVRDNRVPAIPHVEDRRRQKYIKKKKTTRAGQGVRGFF